jgi:O-acetyl-ADP-ribose deacetylase (regulator of RNase III)
MADREHFKPFPSFIPMAGEKMYHLTLLHLSQPEALEVAGSCLKQSPHPESEIRALMRSGWREQLMGAVALLEAGPTDNGIEEMWAAFDAGSWVIPQLAVVLSVLDPEVIPQMKKRILLNCPVVLRGQEKLDPRSRQVIHGSSQLPSYSVKAWSTICWRLSLEPGGIDWLLARFTADQAWLKLLELYGGEGAGIANSWTSSLKAIRPALSLPEPLTTDDNIGSVLAQQWRVPEKRSTYRCPDEMLDLLFQVHPHPRKLLALLLKEGLADDDTVFELSETGLKSPNSSIPISQGIAAVMRQFLAYYCTSYDIPVGKLQASDTLPTLSFLNRVESLRIRVHRSRRLSGRIELTRERIENVNTEAICYGAKDTGDMGGGAANAVYQSCGPEVLTAARKALARTNRQVGDVVVTPAYDHPVTLYVAHLITIKTGTSQGNWCPEPARLGESVYRALIMLERRAETIAFSSLGTGEGRAQPDEIARLMVGGTRDYFRDYPESPLKVLFSLPDYEDYQAFQRAL